MKGLVGFPDGGANVMSHSIADMTIVLVSKGAHHLFRGGFPGVHILSGNNVGRLGQ